MNVSCPQCRTVFRLDPAKITTVSLRARCSACGGIIPVGASVRWADDLTGETAGVAAGRAGVGVTPGGVRPVLATADSGFATAPTPPAANRAQTQTPAASPHAPSTGTAASPQVRVRTPPFSPRVAAAPAPAPAPTPVPPPPVREEPAELADSMGASPVAQPAFGAPLPPPPRTSIPAAPVSTPPPPVHHPTPSHAPTAGSPLTTSANVSAAFSTPSTPAPSSAAVPGPRRPINPFLTNDPNQKARRLARALVSDMVAYHPSKREEGLRNSTLKQLFRDEIKKSYEEYVEQVGREFAESTSHFQEALNDVLAGGRKIF